MRHNTLLLKLLLLFTFSGGARLSFKEVCLNLRSGTTKPTYLDESCLVVHLEPKLSQTAANQRCTDLYPEAQLAYTFDQNKINAIGATIDLSNGVWTSLALDSENKTIHLNRTNSTIENPSWATEYPDPAKGVGILLRYDGLVNAERSAIHPFLCEFFDTPATHHYLSVGRNSKASNALLSKSTEKDMHDCGIQCSLEPKCRSFAYSKSSGECQLVWLYGHAMTLQSDSDFLTMTQQQSEQNCIEPTDCLTDLPKLLVIGGTNRQSIESYHITDPSRNRIVANMSTVLQAHTAVLMSDGRVMIVGGSATDHFTPLAAVTIYDPSANTLTPSANMLAPRWQPGVALLHGSVVVCGGFDGTSSVESCEQFSNGLWATLEPMAQRRNGFQLMNVADKLYAVGGWDHQTTTALTGVERYDMTSDSWASVASLPSPKESFAAAVLLDQIYACDYYQLCHKYDPVMEEWAQIASTLVARYAFGMAAFGGRLYAVAGNTYPPNTERKTVEVYNPETDQWTTTDDLIEARGVHAVVVV